MVGSYHSYTATNTIRNNTLVVFALVSHSVHNSRSKVSRVDILSWIWPIAISQSVAFDTDAQQCKFLACIPATITILHRRSCRPLNPSVIISDRSRSCGRSARNASFNSPLKCECLPSTVQQRCYICFAASQLRSARMHVRVVWCAN